jgi:hypothetical protein
VIGMKAILIFLLGFTLPLSAVANCDGDLKAKDSGTFKRPNYRFVFETGHEVDLVLGRYHNTRLFNSYLVAHRYRTHESLQEAQQRTYEPVVYSLSSIHIAKDLMSVQMIDATLTLSVTLALKKPFNPSNLQIETVSFDSHEPWVRVDFQDRPKRPKIGAIYAKTDVEFAYSGGIAEMISNILPPATKNPESFPYMMAQYAERFFKIAMSVPYARRIHYTLKYYRSLIVVEMVVSGKKQVLAFSTESMTPVELLDLVSGLKALGLSPSHPIFAQAQKLLP